MGIPIPVGIWSAMGWGFQSRSGFGQQWDGHHRYNPDLLSRGTLSKLKEKLLLFCYNMEVLLNVGSGVCCPWPLSGDKSVCFVMSCVFPCTLLSWNGQLYSVKLCCLKNSCFTRQIPAWQKIFWKNLNFSEFYSQIAQTKFFFTFKMAKNKKNVLLKQMTSFLFRRKIAFRSFGEKSDQQNFQKLWGDMFTYDSSE